MGDDEGARPVPFGVSAATGRPLSPIAPEALTAFLEGEKAPASAEQQALARRGQGSREAAFAVGDVDAEDLSQAGWAVMFAAGASAEIKQALQPLLDHRRAQAGERLFKTFEGPTGYIAGDTAATWLARRNLRLEVVDPELGVPFYLLLVGPPDEIPFEFQYGLDLWWAVGRLWLPTPDDYRAYAESVVRYETMAAVPTSRQLALFAPRHDFDRATQLFVDQVAQPLADGTAVGRPLGERQKFRLQRFVGEPATKDGLRQILSGAVPNGPPALLVTGSHGMEFKPDDTRQEALQGALVCQDWPGFDAIDASHWFSGDDVRDDARVHGLVHFLFACYGAGTPRFDNFDRLGNAPRPVAPKPILSRLPQRLLAHPNGGALAVLGHVERAWAYSFQSPRGGPQIQGFRDVLGRLLRGQRIGSATDNFNLRWAGLSAELAEVMVDARQGLPVDMDKLALAWVARDDARNYIVLGDPAVKLRVEDMPEIA
jgi:hypothetical protein